MTKAESRVEMEKFWRGDGWRPGDPVERPQETCCHEPAGTHADFCPLGDSARIAAIKAEAFAAGAKAGLDAVRDCQDVLQPLMQDLERRCREEKPHEHGVLRAVQAMMQLLEAVRAASEPPR